MQVLTQQELHNLAMNIAGKKLEKMGFEFQAINTAHGCVTRIEPTFY